ncbi:ComF family protein [Halomonas sp. E14]|uniref:ComF family protein n=1 Tax=Halomonas sp. E14 TaxID=3397245 RepID=UPI00403ED1FB
MGWQTAGWRSLAWHRFRQRLEGGLRLAMPGRCNFCLAPAEPGHSWCAPCFESLSWNTPACPGCAEPKPPGSLEGRRCGRCLVQCPAYRRAWVPLRYEGDVARLMQRFKFHASPRAGAVLLELFLSGLPEPAVRHPQALMPVPLHSQRARERGFDQAEWLTRRLAHRLGLPLCQAQRRQATPSQRGLGRDERMRNLRQAFHVEEPLPLRLTLIDDVMTTGATLDALAEACRAAGATEVEVWAFARTPAPGVATTGG